MARKSDGSVRMEITDELVTILEELAARNNSGVTTEIKDAIALRAFFSRKVSEGARIVIESPAKPAVAAVPASRTYVDWR